MKKRLNKKSLDKKYQEKETTPSHCCLINLLDVITHIKTQQFVLIPRGLQGSGQEELFDSIETDDSIDDICKCSLSELIQDISDKKIAHSKYIDKFNQALKNKIPIFLCDENIYPHYKKIIKTAHNSGYIVYIVEFYNFSSMKVEDVIMKLDKNNKDLNTNIKMYNMLVDTSCHPLIEKDKTIVYHCPIQI